MDNIFGLLSMACGCACPLLIIAPFFVGLYKVFEKAGRPGWEGLVPFYNLYILTIEIAKQEMLMVILMFVPFANIYSSFVVSMEVAKRFGKEQGFGIGLFLLPMIFYPLIGFSKDAVYDNSPGAAGGGGRSGGGYIRPRRDRDDD